MIDENPGVAMELIADLMPVCAGKSFYIHTYGCQMNVRDSETLAGWLVKMGYFPAENPEEADAILFNTCCIREHAEARVIGSVGALRKWRAQKPGRVVGVCGCMMQQPGQAEKLLKKYPFVDFALGPQSIDELPRLMHEALLEGKRGLALRENAPLREDMPRHRARSLTAFVNIMAGCNNFCSYCIVPYVRGRERSRETSAIVEEVASLAAQGVREVTLLGQNVNSYRQGQDDFASLLHKVAAVKDIGRIRFMTSHPKDLSDRVIEAIAGEEKICRHVHLPVQSGSTGVLARMNRRYTREGYLQLVDKLRKGVPGICLTTDFIVGFPGETDADFADSLSLVQQVEFDAAYVFTYSPRQGTRAASMPDQVPPDVAHQRHLALLAAQDEISHRRDQAQIGKTVEVLFEGVDGRTGQYLVGKAGDNRTVHAPGRQEWIGSILPVTIKRAGAHTLHGEIVPS
nr:tRNA (N6-isopentenyl adenosine(37)-C2)-methylthiotransferase MiaB [bacterium]